jgi:hypothetical protein
MQDLAKLHQWSSEYAGWFALITLLGFTIAIVPIFVLAWKQFKVYRPEIAALSELRKRDAHRERAFKAIDRLRDKVTTARLLHDDIRHYISALGFAIACLVSASSLGLATIGMNILHRPSVHHTRDLLFSLYELSSAGILFYFFVRSMQRVETARFLETTIMDARRRMEAIVQQQGLTDSEASAFVQMVLDKDENELKRRAEIKGL